MHIAGLSFSAASWMLGERYCAPHEEETALTGY
jgi:hypothetical protein